MDKQPPPLTWFNAILLIAGSVGANHLLLYAMKTRRYKHLDTAEVREKDAKIREINANTEIRLATETLGVVRSLREQLQAVIESQEKVQEELTKERENNWQLQQELRQKELKIDNMQRLLESERDACKEMAAQLEQAMVNLKRYEQSHRKPPL